jgi:hypothetical protein
MMDAVAFRVAKALVVEAGDSTKLADDLAFY